MMRIRLHAAVAALLLPWAAACGDDSVTTPDPVSPAEVAGGYEVCEFRFTPTAGFLQAVDVRTAAFELGNADRRPRLFANQAGTFELEFTPKGEFTDVEVPGTFTTGVDQVHLRFTNTTAVPLNSLLLPPEVTLSFDSESKTMSVSGFGAYRVPRDNYAELAGLSEEEKNQLQPEVEGRLALRFAANSCN